MFISSREALNHRREIHMEKLKENKNLIRTFCDNVEMNLGSTLTLNNVIGYLKHLESKSYYGKWAGTTYNSRKDSILSAANWIYRDPGIPEWKLENRKEEPKEI